MSLAELVDGHAVGAGWPTSSKTVGHGAGRPTCWTRNSARSYVDERPGAEAVYSVVTIASPSKNMVRGWLALLTVVTPSGDPV